MSAPAPSSGRVPAVQRRRTPRQLATARELRPRDIFDLDGISPSQLCHYATKLPEEQRPLARLIRGAGGRKGLRLYDHAAWREWLACHDSAGNFDLPRWQAFKRAHLTPLKKAA